VEEVKHGVDVDPHGAVLLFLWLPVHGADVLFLFVLVGKGILGGELRAVVSWCWRRGSCQ
jgi:hypothetical protein